MATKSVTDIAIDNIDAQIRDLERAKAIIQAAANDASDPVVAPKKRGRKRKAGLPTAPSDNVE